MASRSRGSRGIRGIRSRVEKGDIVNERMVAFVFECAARRRYNPGVYDQIDEQIMEVCRRLYDKDYECQVVTNLQTPSAFYPTKLIIPVEERAIPEERSIGGKSSTFNAPYYQKMYEVSQNIRSYKRFPVPAMLWNGKFFSRTASLDLHLVPRNIHKMLLEEDSRPKEFQMEINIATAGVYLLSLKFYYGMKIDKNVLNHLYVNYIFDLRMRDGSKDYPKFIEICEIFQNFYAEYKTAHLPYPGIEFFEIYYRTRKPEQIFFKWAEKTQPLFDLALHDMDAIAHLEIDFTQYQTWSLLDQTLNYLQVLNTYLTSETLPTQGILLHCIAGQDRTALFVTLLRLSLWADGLMHATLSPLEMLFLTVAYDWYLFGHDLHDCLKRGYWIMHFCYNILDHLASERFSLRQSEEQAATCVQLFRRSTDREKKLVEVKKLFLKFYSRIERRPIEEPSTSTGRR